MYNFSLLFSLLMQWGRLREFTYSSWYESRKQLVMTKPISVATWEQELREFIVLVWSQTVICLELKFPQVSVNKTFLTYLAGM